MKKLIKSLKRLIIFDKITEVLAWLFLALLLGITIYCYIDIGIDFFTKER